MPLNTVTAAIYILPVVIKTLLKHSKKKGIKFTDGDHSEEATDEIFFDEGFHIVKSFIYLGTLNTVESLQEYTNTHVPAPWWAAVSPVQVPLVSCNKAADVLIDWFGPEELRSVVGGERWWQVRGLDGIDAEWVTEKRFLRDNRSEEYQNLPEHQHDILRMEHLQPVMLYVHGGGYFWGSINTHRYQVIRYARKMRGRAFAVNYRKAPQYPWPCPLQDVLAAYFYLIDPPSTAVHTAIPPDKIILAGDSAGAGLCISVLTVLRDLGIPQPAGAVLISPWVDLTHSFPSVMKNVETDIIPPHGFIHKPSTLWPIHAIPPEGRARVVPTQTNPPPQPGHADTLEPDAERVQQQVDDRARASAERGKPVHARDLKEPESEIESQQDMMSEHPNPDEEDNSEDHASPAEDGEANPPRDPNGADAAVVNAGGRDDDALSFFEPKPPKVLMDNPDEKPLELLSQIQLYATNEQLTHPLVSPVVQGSLGNLCPLYIIAGDGEVLRDEIIYLAHKAAHPKEYPTRTGALRDGRRQKENAEKFQEPTKVHLQVFDGMCHVLTVFTFTPAATYAYRAIAEFAKHVTTHSAEHLERNPFPELHRPPQDVPESDDEDEEGYDRPARRFRKRKNEREVPERMSKRSSHNGAARFKETEMKAEEEVKKGEAEQDPDVAKPHEETSGTKQEKQTEGSKSSYSRGRSQENNSKDIPGVYFIRERVSVSGHVRSMEPPEELEALRLPPRLIAIIKEKPVRRWLAGQELWDRKFHSTARHVIRRRKHYEEMAEKLIRHAFDQGLVHVEDGRTDNLHRRRSHDTTTSSGIEGDIIPERRWGPLDLKEEAPPPSAIAHRRDTREAVSLLKMNIFHSAPATHKTVPKLKTSDQIRAAFDPLDHPTKAPRQSISEQQHTAHVVPFHGVRMWQGIVSLFMHKSSKKAVHGKRHAQATITDTAHRIKSGLMGSGNDASNAHPNGND